MRRAGLGAALASRMGGASGVWARPGAPFLLEYNSSWPSTTGNEQCNGACCGLSHASHGPQAATGPLEGHGNTGQLSAPHARASSRTKGMFDACMHPECWHVRSGALRSPVCMTTAGVAVHVTMSDGMPRGAQVGVLAEMLGMRVVTYDVVPKVRAAGPGMLPCMRRPAQLAWHAGDDARV